VGSSQNINEGLVNTFLIFLKIVREFTFENKFYFLKNTSEANASRFLSPPEMPLTPLSGLPMTVF
jgi:hypothetical protein